MSLFRYLEVHTKNTKTGMMEVRNREYLGSPPFDSGIIREYPIGDAPFALRFGHHIIPEDKKSEYEKHLTIGLRPWLDFIEYHSTGIGHA